MEYESIKYYILGIASKAHASYYSYLWQVRLYHIFQRYLIRSTILGKKLSNLEYVLDFLYTLCVKYFLL